MFNRLEEFKKTSETLKEAALADTKRSPITETLLFVLEYNAVIMLMALLTIMITSGVSQGSDTYTLLCLGAFIVAAILTLFFVTKIEKRSLRSMGFSRDNILSQLVKGLVLGFGMFVIVVIIGMLIGEYSFEGFDLSSLSLAIPYIVAFIIQPFTEEIYTRGWIIPLFSKNYSVYLGVLVSVLFFVTGHIGNNGINVIGIINIIIMGVLLAVLFLKCDNIWICGAVHSAWNFTQSYLLGFNVSGFNTSALMHFTQKSPNIINGGAYGPEAGIIATVITLLALILIWKVDFNK